MLAKAALEKIVHILRKDCRRALRMHVQGFPSPYYCSFLLRDTDRFSTLANSGSTYRRQEDKSRHVYCDIRVGSYRYDQTTEGNLTGEDEEAESRSHVSVPIDEHNYNGLRMALWRLSEAKFREALSEYNEKESSRISTVDPNSQLPSFSRHKRATYIQRGRPDNVDEEYWTQFCKKASVWMSQLPQITVSWIEFEATQETKVFVNTEGSLVVQHSKVFTLNATLRKLTKEGEQLEQELVVNCASVNELPDMRVFKRLLSAKYERLLKLIKAKQIHAFSGPVLLCPQPAGVLFHEAIGHRLEGNRLLSSGEGQTFKGQLGKKILNIPVHISDNPRLKSFQGIRCVGAYSYDDEGVRAHNTELVRDGVLKGFLTSRATLDRKRFQSNGHARNERDERPISRMGVTLIEAKYGLSFDQLKERLIQEIKRQGKPFGMIVYETSGGETETTSYNFQAFAGEISYATLVYRDGHEETVRGVNFVGTPLQALGNVLACGKELEVDNGFCGAESGFIPVTTISPAVLIRNLELQAKEVERVTQYILPRPKLLLSPRRPPPSSKRFRRRS